MKYSKNRYKPNKIRIKYILQCRHFIVFYFKHKIQSALNEYTVFERLNNNLHLYRLRKNRFS